MYLCSLVHQGLQNFCNEHGSPEVAEFLQYGSSANKRLYFIVLLKRANVPLSDILNFYCTVIRPVLEYCAPVFHHALPQYLEALPG